nr:MAG TPA: hypothetical protein [Caudoviricetes sp.]
MQFLSVFICYNGIVEKVKRKLFPEQKPTLRRCVSP